MSDNKELSVLRMRLKSGEYDGIHIMAASIAVEGLISAREQIQMLKADNERLRSKGMTIGVGGGTGELFVHGDYESVKACQAKLIELERARKSLTSYGFEDCSQELWSPPANAVPYFEKNLMLETDNEKLKALVANQQILIDGLNDKYGTEKGCPEVGCNLDAPCPDCGPSLLG